MQFVQVLHHRINILYIDLTFLFLLLLLLFFLLFVASEVGNLWHHILSFVNLHNIPIQNQLLSSEDCQPLLVLLLMGGNNIISCLSPKDIQINTKQTLKTGLKALWSGMNGVILNYFMDST